MLTSARVGPGRVRRANVWWRASAASAFVTLTLVACGPTSGTSPAARVAEPLRARLDPSTSGLVLIAVGDVDGDGTDEVACGMPFVAHGSARDAGAFVILARDGNSVGAIERGRVGETLGFHLARDFDRDADGFDEVLVTAPSLGADAPNGGAILAYSLRAGRFVSRCDAPAGLATFGVGAAVVSDRDGDGSADYAVIESTRKEWLAELHLLRVHSSKTGREIASWDLDTIVGAPAARPTARFAAGVISRMGPLEARASDAAPSTTCGDVLALVAPSSAHVVVVALESAAPRMLAQHIGPGFSGFGETLAVLEPTDGSTWFSSPWIVASRGRNVELVTWVDGRADLRTLQIGDAAQQLGAAVASCPDLDGDGQRDVLVGAPGPAERGAFYGVEITLVNSSRSTTGYVVAVSSGTRQPIRRFQGADPWFGRAIAVFEDRVRPERSRVAIGAGRPETPVIHVFDLATGASVARRSLP